jgi:ankyrin repeat protein
MLGTWMRRRRFERELKSGSTEILREYLQAGGDPDRFEQMGFPISLAINHHNVEAVKLFLEHGAATYTPEEDIENTPENDSIKVRIPIYPASYSSFTVLHTLTAAAFHGYADIVLLLLDHGVPVDDYYLPYTTALHEACLMRCGHDCEAWDFPCKWGDPADDTRFLETVCILLEAGADINAVCYAWPGPQTQYTPVHFAVESCNLPIVKLLVERGADLSIPDDVGVTPLETALHIQRVAQDLRKRTDFKYDIDPIVEYLKSHLE